MKNSIIHSAGRISSAVVRTVDQFSIDYPAEHQHFTGPHDHHRSTNVLKSDQVGKCFAGGGWEC